MLEVNHVEAKQLKDWLTSGEAILVDVREPGEFSEWRIPRAISMPLTNIAKHLENFSGETRKIVFQCASGPRGQMAASEAIEKYGDQLSVYNLEGGLEAWKNAGFNIARDGDKPETLPIMRQVQIAAGSLLLFFSLLVILGVKTASFFTLFIGGGLLFAGLTGWCGMALLLQKMPWNQKK